MDYVYGYTIANDVTARDIQRHHGQWFKGKIEYLLYTTLMG